PSFQLSHQFRARRGINSLLRDVVTREGNQIRTKIISNGNRPFKVSRIDQRPVMQIRQMNDAKTIQRAGKLAQENLLTLNCNHERLSQSQARHLAQRRLDDVQPARFLSQKTTLAPRSRLRLSSH